MVLFPPAAKSRSQHTGLDEFCDTREFAYLVGMGMLNFTSSVTLNTIKEEILLGVNQDKLVLTLSALQPSKSTFLRLESL